MIGGLACSGPFLHRSNPPASLQLAKMADKVRSQRCGRSCSSPACEACSCVHPLPSIPSITVLLDSSSPGRAAHPPCICAAEPLRSAVRLHSLPTLIVRPVMQFSCGDVAQWPTHALVAQAAAGSATTAGRCSSCRSPLSTRSPCFLAFHIQEQPHNP